MSRPTWLVRCYNDNEVVVDSFVIRERSEIEAMHEAEADPRVLNSSDWTMTKTKGRN